MHHRLVAALFVVTAVLSLFVLCTVTPARLAAEDAGANSASTATTTTTSSADSKADSKTVRMLGGGPENIKLTPEEQRFTELTNAERTSRNLNELTVAPLLVKVAREKSKEMYDLDYWGHESPVKEKRTAMRRVLYYLPEPPKTMLVGENLFYCSVVNVEAGHQALMNSPTHRENILNPDYQYIGIGTFTAPDGRFWTTEIFLKIQY